MIKSEMVQGFSKRYESILFNECVDGWELWFISVISCLQDLIWKYLKWSYSFFSWRYWLSHEFFSSVQIKKNTALPLLGAAVGTCIAGPVGLIAGFKIGAMSCLASGTLGYFSGKVVQTRVNNLPTIEMIENVRLPPSQDQSNENRDSDE